MSDLDPPFLDIDVGRAVFAHGPQLDDMGLGREFPDGVNQIGGHTYLVNSYWIMGFGRVAMTTAAMTQAHIALDPLALAVRAPMGDGIGHPRQNLFQELCKDKLQQDHNTLASHHFL